MRSCHWRQWPTGQEVDDQADAMNVPLRLSNYQRVNYSCSIIALSSIIHLCNVIFIVSFLMMVSVLEERRKKCTFGEQLTRNAETI